MMVLGITGGVGAGKSTVLDYMKDSFMDTYLYAKKLPTLQYKLYEIMNQATMKMDVHAGTNVQTAVTPMSVRMAVTIVATVPIVIVYPFLQKYFIGGMTLGSVKD